MFDRDAALSLAAAACAALAIVLLATDPRPPPASEAGAPAVATVQSASRPLRLRASDELGWRNISAGGAVREKDALFVPPATEARLQFQDGTTLELDERSLVVVEAPPRGKKKVDLRQGSFAGVAGKEGMDVATPQGTARLSPSAQVQVAVEQGTVQLQVTGGEATIASSSGSRTLSKGQRGELSGGGFAEVAPWPVALQVPERGHRKFFRGAPPSVELSWKGELPEGAVLEVARDRGFAFVLQQTSAASGELAFTPDEAGVYWWRVTDGTHGPLSEARRFSLLEDVPPVTLMPRPGDVVLAPPGQAIDFVWTSVRGVSKYRVELSPTPGFEKVALERQVDQAQVRLSVDLAEATWFWRVRSADEDRGDSGPSEPVAFRLIHKQILDAPELLAPEIEVTPDAPKKK